MTNKLLMFAFVIGFAALCTPAEGRHRGHRSSHNTTSRSVHLDVADPDRTKRPEPVSARPSVFDDPSSLEPIPYLAVDFSSTMDDLNYRIERAWTRSHVWDQAEYNWMDAQAKNLPELSPGTIFFIGWGLIALMVTLHFTGHWARTEDKLKRHLKQAVKSVIILDNGSRK